jgi:sporulation protein YlmC with PRC-barrel domain
MKSSRHAWIVALSAALFLSGLGWLLSAAEPNANDWSSLDLRRHRLEVVRGMNVEDANGEKIGRLKDLILDARLAELKYGIIGSGSFAGLGSQRKIVPAHALSLGTAKRNTLALEAVRSVWKQTPTFKRGNLVRLQDPNWVRQLSRLYPKPKLAVGTNSLPTPKESPHPYRHTNSTRKVYFASELIGLPLVNGSRERLGDVIDLLIDFDSQKLPLAVVASKLGSGPSQDFVLPLACLRFVPDQNLLVNLDGTSFERARTFDLAHWKSMETGRALVYRYDDRRADNSGRNVRDRQASSATSFDQSNYESDRRLTQLIRQAIVNSRELSLTAKNVKVITIEGKVTLRGPVRTQAEKEHIERTASQIAGASQVANQIEVIGD